MGSTYIKWKASGISQQKIHNLSIRIMQDHMFLWYPGKNCYSLAGKFGFISHIHQILYLQISIYFDLYRILLMEKYSIPWKTVKGTWSNSLLKKIKSFGKMELRRCMKNGRRQWNKRVNTLFNEVLGENEKCLLFLLKNWRNFLANPWILFPYGSLQSIE